MTRQDKQKLNILIVLVVVLGLTLVLGYWMNQPGPSAAVPTSEPRASTSPQTASDARIRMDVVEKPDVSEDFGRNNVFQYHEGRPAPPRGGPSTPVPPPSIPPSMTSIPVVTPPPVPPPPPQLPFKYQGFAIVSSTPPALTAFLEVDPTRHYNVTVGEVLMGRYRIAGITDKFVEVEDLQSNRRQTLPLQK